MQDDTQDHDYLPIAGLPSFLSASQNLVFGENANPALLSRIASVQTISGTGANHTAARFLLESLNPKAVWFPDPTWPNHHIIWDLVSKNVKQKSYPYYNPQTRALDFTSMMQTLDNDAKPGDVILLHACAHNPTGLDPTQTQWREVASLCKRKGLFPLFDAAYLGFATGDVAMDAWPLRHFASLQDIEFGIAQSFSKNFGLYSERVGAFHLVTRDSFAATKAKALLEHIQRGEISTPPAFGARIVATVLGNEASRRAWERDLKDMAGRIKAMRRKLFEGLNGLGTPGDWSVIIDQVCLFSLAPDACHCRRLLLSHLDMGSTQWRFSSTTRLTTSKQLGMFSYTGLTSTQVIRLRQKYHIYLLSSGRASISGCEFYYLLTFESLITPSHHLENRDMKPHVAEDDQAKLIFDLQQ